MASGRDVYFRQFRETLLSTLADTVGLAGKFQFHYDLFDNLRELGHCLATICGYEFDAVIFMEGLSELSDNKTLVWRDTLLRYTDNQFFFIPVLYIFPLVVMSVLR